MSESERCCFFINMDIGGVALGIVSFIISACITTASLFYLTVDRGDLPRLENAALRLHALLGPYLSQGTVDILLWVTLCIGTMSMTSSCLLIFGIKMARPGFILCYFVFGIYFTIAAMLGGLLLLLEKYWIASILIFLGSSIKIHFLMIVLRVYYSTLGRQALGLHERLLEETVD